MKFEEKIILKLRSICTNKDKIYPLHEPIFNANEWNYVKECIDTGWVSSAGKYVDKFEEMICDFTGLKYAVATVNGTSALHIALITAGVLPGDEVLLPDFTFVATANAVSYCNAIPHFVDINEKDLGVDAAKLYDYLRKITIKKNNKSFNKKTNQPIKALIVMHTFGHPADLDALLDVCKQFKIILIEDAAESIGSYYKNKHTGNWGLVSSLSFNGNKIITTGGGGAVITNNKEIAKRAKHLTTTAKMPHAWEYIHDQIGFNYRLPNINAALGCAQMEILPKLLKKKRILAEKYNKLFKDVQYVKFITEPENTKSNYWLNALLFENTLDRDLVLKASNKTGLMTRPPWELMHKLNMYKKLPRMENLSSEKLQKLIINIPSSPGLIN